jgi:hypothetical protein
VDDRLTLVSWLVVDEHGNEAERPDDEWLDGGGVRDVPAVGDSVILANQAWLVVHRLWGQPIPAEGAMTPRQSVTLHIRGTQ